jgi:hypothetical protein
VQEDEQRWDWVDWVDWDEAKQGEGGRVCALECGVTATVLLLVTGMEAV